MIATAFVNSDLDEILDAGTAALDRKSEHLPIVADVRRWHRDHPHDWRSTRRLIRDKYTLYEDRTRNQNGRSHG
jgi:hypothetical protein